MTAEMAEVLFLHEFDKNNERVLAEEDAALKGLSPEEIEMIFKTLYNNDKVVDE
jgi:hypothetical protein